MRLKATEIWLYRRLPRIPWAQHVSNGEENENKKGRSLPSGVKISGTYEEEGLGELNTQRC